MRLICPNCDAQYEVPTDVIPLGGRDVQCSNCGHTWFQSHPDDPEVPEPEEATLPDETPNWDPEPEPEYEEDIVEEQPAAPMRRELDPSVKDVLREEAELESRRRADDTGGLESQPDLGLDQSPEDELSRRQRQARERMARIRGESAAEEYTQAPAPEPAAVAAAASAATAAMASSQSRRDLLPDIDEINQTLRASDDRQPGETPQGSPIEDVEPERRGGFSRGFFYMIVLFAIGAAVYIFAPQIKESFPQATQVLDSYVDKVDMARVWLDEQVKALLAKLDSLSSEAPAETPTATDEPAVDPADVEAAVEDAVTEDPAAEDASN